ncbi:MAG TPA: hypothetical protein VHM88_16775 [Candidatus Acidoferrales bacterium]|jgi:hypothetical protein|nr:hypothetical protein [Candidatus Acidoferrales bacterium]
MVLRLNHSLEIENLRNHPAETVEQLRYLLASGAPARPDPRRSGFYEVENHSRVFYIHISPVNGKVLLLATWTKDARPATAGAAHEAA